METYRHLFHDSTIFSYQDIGESMIFSNGGTHFAFFVKVQCQFLNVLG